MELSGEEKKLQALFSELKSTDEHTAPRFATVWNRAQLAPRRIRAFNPAFVGAMGLLVCALISLVVWSRYTPRTPQQIVTNAPATPAPANTTFSNASGPQTDVKPRVKSSEAAVATHRDKLAGRRHAQLAAATDRLTQDAKTISNWQSPTSALLSSPSDELFSSLPQFDQSSSDLKSFLPSRPN